MKKARQASGLFHTVRIGDLRIGGREGIWVATVLSGAARGFGIGVYGATGSAAAHICAGLEVRAEWSHEGWRVLRAPRIDARQSLDNFACRQLGIGLDCLGL